eukprot:6474459-Amphidinium_carterae.1
MNGMEQNEGTVMNERQAHSKFSMWLPSVPESTSDASYVSLSLVVRSFETTVRLTSKLPKHLAMLTKKDQRHTGWSRLAKLLCLIRRSLDGLNCAASQSSYTLLWILIGSEC